jgi:hypothetical protein
MGFCPIKNQFLLKKYEKIKKNWKFFDFFWGKNGKSGKNIKFGIVFICLYFFHFFLKKSKIFKFFFNFSNFFTSFNKNLFCIDIKILTGQNPIFSTLLVPNSELKKKKIRKGKKIGNIFSLAG